MKKSFSRAISKLSFVNGVLVFFTCLLIFIVLGLKLGFVDISWQVIVNSLLNKIFGVGMIDVDNSLADIVVQLRLPRVLLAAGVGMGLALSGIVMQAVVQNPLADPYILGISSGASLGATSAIFLGVGAIFGGQAIGVCAFWGALVVSAVVLTVSNSNTKKNTTKLLLTGMALGMVCSSISSFIVYIGRNKEGIETLTYWLMGSVANARLPYVIVLLVIVLLAFAYFCTQIRILDLMLLGYENAITLGVDLNKYVPKYLLLNSLVVGFVIFNAGTIGFLGLVVPHFVRSFAGGKHKKVLPLSVIIGGLFSVGADILSRTLVPGLEIPIGTIFALVGAPCFVYMILQKKYRFGGT